MVSRLYVQGHVWWRRANRAIGKLWEIGTVLLVWASWFTTIVLRILVQRALGWLWNHAVGIWIHDSCCILPGRSTKNIDHWLYGWIATFTCCYKLLVIFTNGLKGQLNLSSLRFEVCLFQRVLLKGKHCEQLTTLCTASMWRGSFQNHIYPSSRWKKLQYVHIAYSNNI